ncbi:MAG: hypothetical protein ACYCT1_08365 [Steroidobacteraceae bacterium]
MLFVHQVAVGTPTLLAGSSEDGALVTGLTPGVVLELAGYYAIGDVADFQRLAQTLANQAVTAAETATPEQTSMQLQITGLWNPVTGASIASALAAGVNQDWSDGEIVQTVNGVTEALPAWAGASAIAYADDATGTLTLQWIKGQPWVWVIVGVLVVVAAVALYDVLTGSKWSLTGWLASSGAGGAGIVATVAGFVERDWPWILLGLGVASAAPWVEHEIARSREAENELRYAKAGGF